MNIFYFLQRWPLRNQSTLSQRIFSISQSLLNMGHELTLLSANTIPTNNDWQIRDYPVQIQAIDPNKIASSIMNVKIKPDIAIFNGIQSQQKYSIHIYNKWNSCGKILQINNLPNLSQYRKSIFEKNKILSSSFLLPNTPIINQTPLSSRDLCSIYRSDCCICANDFIRFVVQNYAKDSPNTYNIGFGLPLNQFHAQIKQLDFRPFNNRNHFVYLGDGSKPSNVQQLQFLVNQVWPKIRQKLPGVQLHVYGWKVKAKGNWKSQGVIYEGQMEQLNEISEYKALLYCNIYEVANKGRILDSWYAHTPVVTTPLGSEGMFMYQSHEQSQHGFISESELTQQQSEGQAILQQYYKNNSHSKKLNMHFGGSWNNWTIDEFAQSAYKLYTDASFWQECVKIGQKIVIRNYGEERMQRSLKKLIAYVEMNKLSKNSKKYQEHWRDHSRAKLKF